MSKVGNRSPDKFVSPEDQLRLIQALCTAHGWSLDHVFQELDQSGYRTKFEKRRGLYPATRMVEAGQADIVVMAFMDRMARNIVVQTEFLGRVGRAGGEVWSADWGQIQTDSAVADLSTGMLGLVAQFMARQTAEKTHGPKQRAIASGIPTFPHIPLGYRKDDITRRLVIEPVEAALVREIFERRLAGASYHELRDWLRAQGIQRSTRGIQEILHNRIYLGELHFGRPKSKGGAGEMVNLHAHEAIVDKALFDSVRPMRVGPRGSAVSKHPGVLARMGILRCATCGRAMILGSHSGRPTGKAYYNYRCPPIGDCPRRATISGVAMDTIVADWMRQVAAEGSYSAAEQVQAAEVAVEAAGAAVKRAVRNLASLEDTVEAQEVVAELRAEQTAAEERLVMLRRSLGPTYTLSPAGWGELRLSAQRDLVRALIRRIEVSPADRRGGTQASAAQSGRVRILPFLE